MDCFDLKEWIETLIRKEKLNEYVEESNEQVQGNPR